MEIRGPGALDAWVGNEKIRRWFEIVVDTAVEPHQQRAYICKGCWHTFDASIEVWRLEIHAEGHGDSGVSPYGSKRAIPLVMSGEQLVNMHQLLFERFNVVTPEVGAWKFQCKNCRERLPHRSSVAELLGHFQDCKGTEPKGPIQ